MSTSTTPFVSRTRTAEAINVRLLDTISPLLELTSYQLLGASHTMVPSLLEGRVLQFGFSNIMLPDNSSDPLGSQGFVSFRLKPIVDLLVGEELTNAADIYFDIKPPIRTNTTTLIAELPEGMADLHRSIMWVSPNPADKRVKIMLPWNERFVVEAFDLEGREVMSRTTMSVGGELDISPWAAGMYVLCATDAMGSRHQVRFVKH